MEGRKVDEDKWFDENDECRCMSADLSESKGMEVDGHNNRSQGVGWGGFADSGWQIEGRRGGWGLGINATIGNQ